MMFCSQVATGILLLIAAPHLGLYPILLMKILCFALFACAFNLLLGFTGGSWLVTYQKGKWAGSAVTWLWVTVFMITGCLAFVAFQ